MLARSMSERSILAPIALALTLGAGLASAQDAPRTAVAPFGGRGAGAVQRLVERALDERADVVDRGEVRDAAGRAGVSGTDASGVSELARALGADLVVQGEVSGTRRAQRVTLVVRAADGAELARGSATNRRGRGGRPAFERAVTEVFDRAASALPARRPAEPEPAIAEPEPEPEPAPPAEAPADGLALVAITGGLSVRTRDAEIDLVAPGTRRYASGAFPEIVLAVEARPFANESHLGRGLFLHGSFAHSVGLGSTTMGTGDAVGTNFVRFALGAGWLAPLGEAAELGLGLAVGYDGYHLGPNVVLPSAEYVYLRPALRGRVRVLREALVIDAEIGYRGVVGLGDIGPSFGAEAGAHGVDVGLGVGGNLYTISELGFTWAARFEWVGYFLSFAGNGSDTDGQSGAESAVRGVLLLGWSFR